MMRFCDYTYLYTFTQSRNSVYFTFTNRKGACSKKWGNVRNVRKWSLYVRKLGDYILLILLTHYYIA